VVEVRDPEAAEEEEAEPKPTPEPPVVESSEVQGSDLDFEKVQRVWPAVMDRLAATAPALAAFFEEARPVGFESARMVVEISFPAAATFNKRKAETPENRERVAEALQTVTGQSLKPAYVLLDDDGSAAEEAPAAKADGVDEEELLERLKSEFDAEEVS
jgi:hypothetical protein